MLEFNWDEAKRSTNIEKHGIDFYIAFLLLQTESLIQEVDDRKDYGELRYRATGKWGDKILVVVYAVDNGTIRIISARRANSRERQIYWREQQRQNQS